MCLSNIIDSSCEVSSYFLIAEALINLLIFEPTMAWLWTPTDYCIALCYCLYNNLLF